MVELNSELARHNMVVQQIRPWEVNRDDVIAAIAATPRELFVPAAYRNLAFMDTEIPLINGQNMLHPIMEGRMLQLVAIKPHDRVLIIGAGSGYLAAVAAKLGREVIAVDIDSEIVAMARENIANNHIEKVRIEEADGHNGWGAYSSFDVIIATGAMQRISKELKENMRVGGRLFVITGNEPNMEATLIQRNNAISWSEQKLFETVVQPLKNSGPPPSFAL